MFTICSRHRPFRRSPGRRPKGPGHGPVKPESAGFGPIPGKTRGFLAGTRYTESARSFQKKQKTPPDRGIGPNDTGTGEKSSASGTAEFRQGHFVVDHEAATAHKASHDGFVTS